MGSSTDLPPDGYFRRTMKGTTGQRLLSTKMAEIRHFWDYNNFNKGQRVHYIPSTNNVSKSRNTLTLYLLPLTSINLLYLLYLSTIWLFSAIFCDNNPLQQAAFKVQQASEVTSGQKRSQKFMSVATYFSNRSCRHGHFERYLKDDRCAVCRRLYDQEREYDSEKSKKRRERDPEKYRARQRDRYDQKRKQYLAQKSEYDRLNRDKRSAIGAKRRADKLNATPPWLTVWQLLEMQHMYTKARKLREKTGYDYHVDHILALRGRTPEGYRFSGLHVPWNLQLLESRENIRKNSIIDLDWVILPPYRGI